MNVRRIKFMFWLVGVVLFAASVWVCAVGLRQPMISPGDVETLAHVQSKSADNNQVADVVSLSDYEKVWDKPLRLLKVQQAPVQKAPETKAALSVAPNINLVGTMVEDGNSFAIIEYKRNHHLLGVGDVLEREIQVLTVESGNVQVMYRGQKFTLESPREEDGK